MDPDLTMSSENTNHSRKKIKKDTDVVTPAERQFDEHDSARMMEEITHINTKPGENEIIEPPVSLDKDEIRVDLAAKAASNSFLRPQVEILDGIQVRHEIDSRSYSSEPGNQQSTAVLSQNLFVELSPSLPKSVFEASGLRDNMKVEEWRFHTFTIPKAGKLGLSKVAMSGLAKNGFFYDEELDDIVCFSCNAHKLVWEEKDLKDIAFVHKILSENCCEHLEICYRPDEIHESRLLSDFLSLSEETQWKSIASLEMQEIEIPELPLNRKCSADYYSSCPNLSDESNIGACPRTRGAATATGSAEYSESVDDKPRETSKDDENKVKSFTPTKSDTEPGRIKNEEVMQKPSSANRRSITGDENILEMEWGENTPSNFKIEKPDAASSDILTSVADAVTGHPDLPSSGTHTLESSLPTTAAGQTARDVSMTSTPSTLPAPGNSLFSGASVFGHAMPVKDDAPQNQPMLNRHLDLSHAAYPLFSETNARRNTFPTGWSDNQSLPDVDELVTLGFFYAGYADCVRCFYCGLGLKSWEPGDVPAEEHAKFRPTCGHLRLIKGDRFIDQVADGDRNIADGQHQSYNSGQYQDTSQLEASEPERSPCQTDPTDEVADLKQLQEENRRFRERHTCKICKKACVDTMFIPCGHLCTCDSCASTFNDCPVCHKCIRATAHIYFDL